MTTPTETIQPVAAPLVGDTLREALESGTRPQQPSAATASLVFGWRALLKIKHVPEQLLDVTMFPIMFTLMFTYLFGGALAGSPREYLQFLLPGIVVQTVLMITMYTGMTLNKDIAKGVFDRFRSLPVWSPAFMVGALLGDAARYTMASSIIVALGLALGYRPEGGPVGVILGVALVLVFAFGLSWIWTTIAMYMRSEQAVMMASMMVLFPITFISNIFVDPETMPGWLQAFVDVNPVSVLATAVRSLMEGSADWGAIGIILAAAAGLTVVFAPITMHRYRTKN